MIKKETAFKLFILIIISLLMITYIPNYCLARVTAQESPDGGGETPRGDAGDPITDPGSYRPGGFSGDEAELITSKAGIIFDIATTVGIVVSVITILILGIKYMVGSVEEKAEYKKAMIPYLIGAFMIMSISTIIKLIASLTEDIF